MTNIAKAISDQGAYTYAPNFSTFNSPSSSSEALAAQPLSHDGGLSRLAHFGSYPQSRIEAELRGTSAHEVAYASSLTALNDARNASAELKEPSLSAPVKKKKKGFFSRLGGAIKKFAQSKFGKILLIGGAIAASFLIPGVGAAMTKAFAALGKGLMGGLTKVATKFGASGIFKGGFKAFLNQQVLPKLGLEGGLKKGLMDLLKRTVLSGDAVKDVGQELLKKFGLADITAKGGFKAVLSQLGSRIGISDQWLERLLGAPTTTAP